tara:strand:+ start:93 stop:239 length:147 start_codon:yes stop_codon:yes gene_type:complete
VQDAERSATQNMLVRYFKQRMALREATGDAGLVIWNGKETILVKLFFN